MTTPLSDVCKTTDITFTSDFHTSTYHAVPTDVLFISTTSLGGSKKVGSQLSRVQCITIEYSMVYLPLAPFAEKFQLRKLNTQFHLKNTTKSTAMWVVK